MPEGKDKPKSLQELTGIPAGTVFGQPESVTPAPPAPAVRRLGPKNQLPDLGPTPEQESGNAARAMQQQINSAIRYRGRLEQQARSYYGNISVTNDELEKYMQMLHDQNLNVQKQREAKRDAQFNQQYGDAVRRNSLVGIDQYKPFIDKARLLKRQEGNPVKDALLGQGFSDADQARLDKRGSQLGDAAPVDMDEILDKDNNVRPEYFRKIYDMTGGNQKQMKQIFADAMQGKRSEFSERGRQSIAQQQDQTRLDELHAATLARPLYYLEQMRQGIHSGLFSTGNFIANIGAGSAYEAANNAFGDGTYSAAEHYVAAQERFNRASPSTIASTESQNWYNLDHILSSGAHMTGEFAPSLFLGGEGRGMAALENSLMKAGVQGGMKGAAARFAARAVGDSFSGRLMQNSLHMVKTAFPPVFSGYVEDGLAKGYTADQAVARAYPRALINTLALSVPGAVSRVGIRYATLPSRILSSATEQGQMRALMGTASQFIKGPLSGGAAFAAGSLADSWQNYQEDMAEGRDGVNDNAKFVDYMNFEQSKKEGLVTPGTTFEEYKQLPEAQQFGYGHAFKDMAEQAMFGVIWGSIEKTWHGSGVMPNMVQADYLRTAVNDPAQFNDAVDRTVRRGKIDAAKGQSMKAFVARIAPTVEAGEAMGLKHRTAVQYAVEAERMKDLAREMQTLTDQGKLGEVVDGNGKKIPTLLAQNKNSLEWTPEDGKQLQARINDIQTRYLQSQKTVQQLSEGTYLKGRTVSGDEMVRISGRFSPGDGLREGQAAQIISNGPYRTEVMGLQRYRQNPQIQQMAAEMMLGEGESAKFQPQNQNPAVVDRNGDVIDGAKRIAYSIANGAEQMEVARPLKLAEIAPLVKDETENAPAAAPVVDNLDPEAADILSGARAVYDNELAIARTPTEAERKAGVTNKETRAYYAAAMHLHEQGVPRDQAIDLLRRLNGGNISAAMAEAFHNDVAARVQAGETAPVVPGMSADITAGVSPQVTDFARRMLNGETMEEAKDQEFYDDHRQEIESEYERLSTPSPAPEPEAVPDTSIHHIAGENTKDDVLAASPYWDKSKGELLPEFQYGQPGFEKVEEWLEARERGEETTAGNPQPVSAAKELPAPQRDGFVRMDEISQDYTRFHGEEPLDEKWINETGMQTADGRFDQPVKLWRDPADGQLYVLDGKNRLESARRMGWDHVNAEIREDLDLAAARQYAEATRSLDGREVLADGPVRFVTSDGKYFVSHNGTGLKVINRTTGKDAVGKYRSAAIEEAMSRYKFNRGLSLDSRQIAELPTAADFGYAALESSANPAEVALAWSVQEAGPQQMQGAYDAQILEHIAPILSTTNDYTRGDMEGLFDGNAGARMHWLTSDRKKGSTLSDIAHAVNESMYDGTGIAPERVTPDDILDFMKRHPAGVRGVDLERVSDSPLAQDLARKFERMTGFPLNKRAADMAMSQQRDSLSPEEQAIFDQEIRSYEHASQLYDDAVANGSIDPGAEDARNPSVEGTSPDVARTTGNAAAAAAAEQPAARQDGLATKRFGRVTVFASTEVIAQSGWTERGKSGFRALFEQMQEMFGTRMGVVITDNKNAAEYWQERGQQFEDMALVPNAWVSADLSTIHLNIEKCPPSAVMDELGHVWNGWARVNAPQIHEMGVKLAEGSAEMRYMDEYLAGETPVTPEGMSEGQADLWQRYADAYGLRENGRDLLIEEVLTHAIQNQGQMLAATADRARSVSNDGSVKKGTWGKWLESLWSAVRDAAGFRRMTTREFSRITLDEFSRAAAEEIGRGKALTRKIKEAVDADVKRNEVRRKDAKKGEEIDESLQLQVESAGRKPKIETSEEGETSSVESGVTATVMAAMEQVSPSDIYSLIESANPRFAQELLDVSSELSHFKRMTEITDDYQRRLATVLDVIADPSLIATSADKKVMGGISGGMVPKVEGRIGEVFDTLARVANGAAGEESGVTGTRLAQMMVRLSKRNTDALKLPEFGALPKEAAQPKEATQPAAAKPAAAKRAPKAMNEKRKSSLQNLDELLSLPEAPIEGDERFSLPEDPEKESKRTIAAMSFVADSIEDNSVSLSEIMTDVYDQMGDRADVLYPYIKRAYLAYQAEASDVVLDRMDDPRTVRAFDFQALKQQLNASDTESSLEPNSPRAAVENGVGQEDVQPANGPEAVGSDGARGQEVGAPQQEPEPASGNIVPDGDAPADGNRGDSALPDGASGAGESEAGIARGYDSGRSGWFGNEGQRPAAERAAGTPRFADASARGVNQEKLQAQRAAESVTIVPMDRDNIAETLPYLMPSQHDDVAFAEKRLGQPNGYGVLFANGTGTGKTFLALGAAKRMIGMGKTDGIIVAPNEEVIKEWMASAPALGIELNRLADTNDAGRGVSITTYANFGQNDSIFSRPWDFVIMDEAHSIMQSGTAANTRSLEALQAITLHPDGATSLALRRNRAVYDALQLATDKLRDIDPQLVKPEDRKEIERLQQLWNSKVAEAKRLINFSQGDARPRAIFLSATPFAYPENVQWAKGYLFEYPKHEPSGRYNEPNGYQQFMIQNFGYRMKYNKLTKPDANVDTDLMERTFNANLRKQGALSTRSLNLDSDYQRRFALTENAVGAKIDEGLQFLREGSDGKYKGLFDVVEKRFDYLQRARLLEAIKAKEFIPTIQKLHELGRKVVVYYDYNQGGGFSPFRFDDLDPSSVVAIRDEKGLRGMRLQDLAEMFYKERPDLAEINFDQVGSPLETMRAAFPEMLVLNGMENKKLRNQAIERFNDDNDPGANLIMVQAQINAGWSGHDKTSKFPRVMINLGQPTAPTRAIQQEGRIYRVGQHPESNSTFLYGNTGTMWERTAFASKIAERAATAENLAMGFQARGLKRSFIDAFEASEVYTPSLSDGRGSRDADRAHMEELDEFKAAKTFYFAQQKKNARTKAMEGVDYFATPEPLGYKMVQWAQPRAGESWLEPSAGHGAIARFLPERANRTIIEPSTDLFTKAQLNVLGARGIQDTFENLHISNKFDGIVMNPPFGTAGTTASEHVQKAVNHLRPGGRIVALVPVGMFDGKFEKWFSAVDQRGRSVHPDLHLTARIKMPASTFERAGTKVGTQILIIDRAADPRTQSTNATRNIDLSEMQDITSLFDRIEHMDMPSRPGHENATTAPAVMPVPEMGALSTPPSPPNTPAPALNTPPTPAVSGPVAAVQPAAKVKAPVKSFHTKSQKDIWVVERGRSLSDAEYAEAKQAASRHGGYWSSFKGGGAIPGFIFSTPEGAEAFHKELAATAEPASTATVPADYKLPAGATNEQKELYGRWQSAGERLVAAREKIASTRRDLDKRIMDDGANLFGERKATAGSMFDVRVDPAQRDVQLQPLQEAVTKAESELNELGQQLAESEGKASAQREMFSLPMREVVDEARLKADQGSDRAFETYMEGLGEEGQADPEALAARGELFSLPLSRRGRAKSILSVHDKYFIKEDANIGNRELAKMQAGEMARRFQEEIKSTHGEKPSGIFSRKAKAEWEAKWRDTDRAIHIYMDTLRNPAHIADFDKALADAKLKVNDPAATPLEIEKARNIMAQEKIVTLSQNLTKEQKDIADKIGIEYDRIGKLAINNGIIKDVIDNYVSRAWDFGAFSTEEANKFSTSTRHSMKRALDTILEGFTRGFKLKIEGASNNLSTLYREINNVIENQRLLEEGLNMKDEDGKPLFSVSSRRQDYQRIENKSFRKWQYVGRLSDYSSADRASFNRDTIVSPSGAVLRKMDVFAPKDIAKSLNNVLGSSQLNRVESLNSLTRFNANVKKSILSASVFHYIAFTRAHILGHSDWLKNPRFVSPRAAYRAGLELMAADHPLIQKMIQNGMTLGRMQDFTEGVAEHSSALGRKIDELGGFPATARKSLLDFNHAFHKHLFETYGAGLKAFDGIALMKKEMKKYPNENVDVIAKRVAKVMNDSYGGVNWNMHFRGNAFQNPTVRHLSSLLLLAPDWTTSNLRLFRNAFRNNEQGDLYRKMWAKVILRGLTLTAFANAALAAMDDSEEDEDWYDAMVNRYQKGWDAGHLRWTMVDITPLYHAVGGDPEKRSYFSVFGAYSDPLRMMGVSKDKAGNISISSQDFLSHKASFITRATLESFSGENWQHKQFTTMDELLGMDDKGEYKHTQGAHKKGDINPMTGLPYAKTQKAHSAGEAKGGKSKGSLTRYPDYGGGVSIWKRPATIPSYLGAQMRGMLPTALQSLMAAAAGENDWAQFAAQAPGTGVVMSKDPSK